MNAVQMEVNTAVAIRYLSQGKKIYGEFSGVRLQVKQIEKTVEFEDGSAAPIRCVSLYYALR